MICNLPNRVIPAHAGIQRPASAGRMSPNS